MAIYRDSSGRTLADYPRPSVAVDTAVLTVADGRLCVVVVQDGRSGTRRLPGTFLHEGEVLADAVRRSLADKAGLGGLEPEQLQVFDSLGRDDRGWVLSVAHVIAVPVEALGDATIVPVSSVGPLAYDHQEIHFRAVVHVRDAYRERPDPWRLLGDGPFTLLELERLHRAVDPDGTPLRDTFRRFMEPKLKPTGEFGRGTVGKPARLFEHLYTVERGMIAKAQRLAIGAHEGQTDKTGAPYWTHPERVARRVRELYPDAPDEAVAVAWLHDVIEDTPWTARGLLDAKFPSQVVYAVVALTRTDDVPDDAYYAGILRAGGLALMVKHADITDNLDEQRLAALPPATAARLRAKYAKSLDALGLPAPTASDE